MSEQLETIKCVDWTINFFWGCWWGNRLGESPSVDAGCPQIFFFLCSEVHLVSRAAIHPSQESYRSVAQQTGHESWLLLSLTIVNHIFD